MGCSTLYQYLVIVCANICTVAYGAAVGWTSSAVLVLESHESPLDNGPLTLSEIAWVGSIIGIGGIIGTFVIGWMCDKYGRKPSLLFSGVPMVISWFLIIYARNAWYLYASRFLAGFSGAGSFVVIPLLVAEVSTDSIRGALGSILTLAANMGVLIGFLVGNYFHYETVPKLLLAFPILFLTCFYIFPESPWFLMKMNKEEKAEKSLRFYRNVRIDSKDERIEESFQNELNRIRESHQQQSKASLTDAKITLSDFVCQPVAIGIAIMLIHDCCGVFTMVSYTGKIFAQSGVDIPPNEAAIIVGAVQLVGTYLSTIFVDRAGRKIIFSLSCLGTGISHVVLATYIYLSTSVGMDLANYQWISVISFSAVLFIASFGALPIPYVLLGEIMPNKIRGVITPLCLCLSWFETFIFVKIFPPIVEAFGLHSCIYGFAICCFAGALYIVFCIPETKGRSLDDIEKSFKK